ncbi:hypothetical protein GCM10009122_08100 [Fulvivirga kasyanovii]|uniref:30S ribosomal protein THX n=1 Tax=Fulvivirga kasyanovii TaxID=396812 RepID=A0ABW9RNS9_9BACT|nr:30S ribosomal protein THX [Fulvivirga kasyanovii]MTI25784.1 30S ribosomal protein THX [Fulvivirga kasyanovii]
MGKGDRKTKKGKIAMGSYGVSRPRPANQNKATNTTDGKASGAKKTASKKGAKA